MAGIFELKTTAADSSCSISRPATARSSSPATVRGQVGAENGIDRSAATPRRRALPAQDFAGRRAVFVLTAGNGQTIGLSEMYSSASAMENGIASVKKNAPEAKLKDLTAA